MIDLPPERFAPAAFFCRTGTLGPEAQVAQEHLGPEALVAEEKLGPEIFTAGGSLHQKKWNFEMKKIS